MYGFHGMSWLMPISMMLFWGAIIYLIFSYGKDSNKAESSINIAKRRYASGEITVEELNEIKKHL
ncbi:SHOCT domain-containing protein [Vibrio paucivorans]